MINQVNNRSNELKELNHLSNYYDINDTINLIYTFFLENDNDVKNSNIFLNIKLNITKLLNNKLEVLLKLPHEYNKKNILVFSDIEVNSLQNDNITIVNKEMIVNKNINYIKLFENLNNFTHCVCTPEMLIVIEPIKHILIKNNLMPSIETKTVLTNINQYIETINNNIIHVKITKNSNINIPIGNIKLSREKLLENIYYVIDQLILTKPKHIKENYFKECYISIYNTGSFKTLPIKNK